MTGVLHRLLREGVMAKEETLCHLSSYLTDGAAATVDAGDSAGDLAAIRGAGGDLY